MNGVPNIPVPKNEPVLGYAAGSPERAALQAELTRQQSQVVEIPILVGGCEIKTGDTVAVTMPHRHGQQIAEVHQANASALDAAVKAAHDAHPEWSAWRFEDRAAVFLRAAELLAGPWRQVANAATMLGQSKTAHQAEIDSACELIDFYRFNPWWGERILQEQPQSGGGAWNRIDHRPLEGFVYAITPFNFTAIGGNLPTAPALMGNTVIWKPSATATLSNYYVMRLLEAAGLPPGVINFVPGPSAAVSDRLLGDPSLAGIHFTGSTEVFRLLWRTVGDRLEQYRSYPRVVGETGGKDFVVAHPSADPQAVAVALVRGAFEYQGQKCSAASRAYLPESLWRGIRDRMVAMMDEIRMGDVADFGNFMGAVIDQRAFAKITGYLDQARKDPGVKIVAGGSADDREGWFIQPTLVQVSDPMYRMLREEIFGPVLTVYVYKDAAWQETLELVDTGSPYALTGALFARDRRAIQDADRALRYAAGNYYVNDKPTGAVVGQQPFGGGRASGTNDKAGSVLNLLRWVSPRTVKETFVPPEDYRYPFLATD
ncbi:MAG TPA: L-glutamate gamma-semialdehyde dehydrogenase [Gemmatimonadales bacterium]